MPTPRKVCVVEDDESVRAALLSLLRSLGYEAAGYGSAEQYLERSDPAPYACLITDIHLPGLSGIELTRLLRRSGEHVPVIMMTGRPEPLLESKARTSGAACLLYKPIEAAALIACLDQLIDPNGA